MSYAEDIYSDLQTLSNDSAVVNDLSPAARSTLSLVRFTCDQALQGKTPEQIAQQLADQAIGAGLQAGQQLLAQIASSISQEMGQLAGAVIPYVGWIVSMLLNAKPAGNVASVEQYTQGALEVYTPVGMAGHAPGFGTGPGGALMPVDLFIHKDKGIQKNGHRLFEYTSLGQALASITEYDGAMDAVHAKLGSNVGIPLARRTVFRALRRRIVDSYNRLSDGGAALWTIYLDLLRHEFDCGHLTPTYVRYLTVFGGAWNAAIAHNSDDDGSCPWGGGTHAIEAGQYNSQIAPITDKLLKQGIQAAQELAVAKHVGPWTFPPLFDSRARQQIYDTVQGWRQTLVPKYVQFETLESKVLAYLKAHQTPKLKITLPAPKVKIAPAVQKAAANVVQNQALKKATLAAAEKWQKAAGPLPVAPHVAGPAATIPVPSPAAPVPTIVPGLSFQISPDTMKRAAGIGEVAPVAAAAALLLFL